MLSWCDPDLMTKQEWEEGYADPIMAGALAPHCYACTAAWALHP
jgi:hypothetical protein